MTELLCKVSRDRWKNELPCIRIQRWRLKTRPILHCIDSTELCHFRQLKLFVITYKYYQIFLTVFTKYFLCS